MNNKFLIKLRQFGFDYQGFTALLTTVLSVTTMPVQADSAKITNTYNYHAYQRFDTPSTWTEARQACKSQGGYLATATRKVEDDWIVQRGLNAGQPWLGGTSEQGGWKWITGESWYYSNFSEYDIGVKAIWGNYLRYYKSSWTSCTNDGLLDEPDAVDLFGYFCPGKAPYICEWTLPFPINIPAPKLLYAIAPSPNTVQLSWTHQVVEGSWLLKGYRIQRKVGSCRSTNPWNTVLDTSINRKAIDSVSPDTTYSYQIAAYYGAQNFSLYSACVSTTTPVEGTPTAPSNIIGQSKSPTQVDLSWTDESNNETGFIIQRKINNDNWVVLKSVGANIRNYSDTNAPGNTNTNNYSYIVRACNDAGCSIFNPNAFTIPFSPTNLVVTVDTAINLTWKDNSHNESGFHIFRKNGVCNSTNPWRAIAKVGSNTTSYTDYFSSFFSGQVHSYLVRAPNYQVAEPPYSYGYSGYTNCVSATAP